MGIPEYQEITSEEFYKLTEHLEIRLELIDGVIYDMTGRSYTSEELRLLPGIARPEALASPGELHQDIVLGMGSAVRDYIRRNGGSCKVMVAPFDVVLNEKRTVVPDLFVVCDPSKMDGKRCNGAPDWVVEVTSSNYRQDYSEKLGLYREAGVKEYWIINPERKQTWVVKFTNIPNTIEFYNFDQNIPVGIYENASMQLKINIAALL